MKCYLYDIQNDRYIKEDDKKVYYFLKDCIFNIETLYTVVNLLEERHRAGHVLVNLIEDFMYIDEIEDCNKIFKIKIKD